jgi:hypothetical protein
MPAPEGFPRYAPGEHVLLFLYPASQTDRLRTTRGLVQGKFTLVPGLAMNARGTRGCSATSASMLGSPKSATSELLATRSGDGESRRLPEFLRGRPGRWVETRPPGVAPDDGCPQAPGRSVRAEGRSTHAITGGALIAALACGLATAALAGGPSLPTTTRTAFPTRGTCRRGRTARCRSTRTWAELGALAPRRRPTARRPMRHPWSSVPTSSFRATVAGDFSADRPGDVTLSNVGLGHRDLQRRGDPRRLRQTRLRFSRTFFGVHRPPSWGSPTIEYAAIDGPEILEAWMVLSGPGRRGTIPAASASPAS